MLVLRYHSVRHAESLGPAQVAETPGMRIKRVWLRGPKAGTVDVLLDNLPGCA